MGKGTSHRDDLRWIVPLAYQCLAEHHVGRFASYPQDRSRASAVRLTNSQIDNSPCVKPATSYRCHDMWQAVSFSVRPRAYPLRPAGGMLTVFFFLRFDHRLLDDLGQRKESCA